MSTRRSLVWVACVVVAWTGRVATAQIYVDIDATGANNGTSWADAFTDLADGLAVPGPAEIWLAEGTYTPAGPGGNRAATFLFRADQALYGGFSGVETARSQRDPAQYFCTLSGDLNGDDLEKFGNISDNSYHLVTIRDAASSVILDGVRIFHGAASDLTGSNSQGGGILMDNAVATINDCWFRENFARSGGAMMLLASTPTITASRIELSGARDGRGAAIYAGAGSGLTVLDTEFAGNEANGGVGPNDGGALFCELDTRVRLERCSFNGNKANTTNAALFPTGGAIASFSTGLEAIDCRFNSNSALRGGAVYTARDSTFYQCVFNGNLGGPVVGGSAGGLYNFLGHATAVACTFSGNSAYQGGGITNGSAGVVTLIDSIVWGNTNPGGGAQLAGLGIYEIQYSCVQDLSLNPAQYPGSINSDPMFIDDLGPDLTPGTGDENLRLSPGSPCIDAADNTSLPVWLTADLDGGARFLNDPATPDTGNGTPPIADMGCYEFTGLVSAGLTIDGGALHTTTTAVTLTLFARQGGTTIPLMQLGNDKAALGPWEPFASTRAWTLASGEGVATVYARFSDVSGTVLATVKDTIIVDTGPPTGSIVINFGSPYALTSTTTLSLSATDPGSGVVDMRLSNDGVSWGAWEPYAATRSWFLPGPDGPKTVYVQYRDAIGHVSATYSDGITLETEPPTGTVVIDGGAVLTNSPAVTLALSATDNLAGVSHMRFSNDNVTWSAWQNYSTVKSWTLSAGDGPKTVYVQFGDWAGNISAPATDTITLDSQPPAGTVVIDSGAAVTSSTSVDLSLSATDAGSGVSDMRISNDGVAWTAWEPFATTRPWTLTAGDGLKTVYVQFRDGAGNASGSVNDSITLSTILPGSATVDAPTTPQADLVLPDWNDTEAEKMSVLRFRITDPGGDGLPTLIDRITVPVSGTAGQAANDIAWAELHDGTARVDLASTITDTQIVFGAAPDGDGTAALTTVADGGFVEYTVFIYLNTSLLGAHDQTYVFDVGETDVGVDAVGSSPMAPDGGAVTPVVGTLFITQLSIAVTPATWVIGPRPLGAVVESGVYTVTNDGNVAEDFAVSAGNGAGGWSLLAAPGLDAFAVELDRAADGSYEGSLALTDQLLAVNVASGGAATTLRLRYSTPTGDTIGATVPQNFTVVLKASLHVP